MSISAINELKNDTSKVLENLQSSRIGFIAGIGTSILMKESQAPLIQAFQALGLRPVQVGVGGIGFGVNNLLAAITHALSKLPLPEWFKLKMDAMSKKVEESSSKQAVKQSLMYLLSTFLVVYVNSALFNEEKDHSINSLFSDTLYQALLYLPYTLIAKALNASNAYHYLNGTMASFFTIF
jgi:hypothetical protein